MSPVSSLDGSLHVAWVVSGVARTHTWDYGGALLLPWLCVSHPVTAQIPVVASKKRL